jgi:hypothetical protein
LVESDSEEEGREAMKLTVDIFLVTWPGDYEWLPYLFKSIGKFVSGFRKVVIVLEGGDDPPRDALDYNAAFAWEIKRCPKYRGTSYEGRSGQALEKLRAWHYSDADRIMYIDSDCVFKRKIDLQTDKLTSIERPPVWFEPWKDVGDAKCWHKPTREILGFNPPYETMRHYPFVYPGWFLRATWEHIGGEERLRKFKDPCDYNVMGSFAIKFMPEFFNVIDGKKPVKNQAIHQFWSFHGAGHPDVVAVLEKLGLNERP